MWTEDVSEKKKLSTQNFLPFEAKSPMISMLACERFVLRRALTFIIWLAVEKERQNKAIEGGRSRRPTLTIASFYGYIHRSRKQNTDSAYDSALSESEAEAEE